MLYERFLSQKLKFWESLMKNAKKLSKNIIAVCRFFVVFLYRIIGQRVFVPALIVYWGLSALFNLFVFVMLNIYIPERGFIPHLDFILGKIR
jgi:hypothetical protein